MILDKMHFNLGSKDRVITINHLDMNPLHIDLMVMHKMDIKIIMDIMTTGNKIRTVDIIEVVGMTITEEITPIHFLTSKDLVIKNKIKLILKKTTKKRIMWLQLITKIKRIKIQINRRIKIRIRKITQTQKIKKQIKVKMLGKNLVI